MHLLPTATLPQARQALAAPAAPRARVLGALHGAREAERQPFTAAGRDARAAAEHRHERGAHAEHRVERRRRVVPRRRLQLRQGRRLADHAHSGERRDSRAAGRKGPLGRSVVRALEALSRGSQELRAGGLRSLGSRGAPLPARPQPPQPARLPRTRRDQCALPHSFPQPLCSALLLRILLLITIQSECSVLASDSASDPVFSLFSIVSQATSCRRRRSGGL